MKVSNTTCVYHHWRQDIWILLVCYNRAWCARIWRSRNIVFLDFGIYQEVCLNNSWLEAWLLIMIDSIDTHQVDHVEGLWYCMFIFRCTTLIILLYISSSLAWSKPNNGTVTFWWITSFFLAQTIFCLNVNIILFII